MHIGLLGCDDVPERFRHIAGGYRDMFESLLRPQIQNLKLTWFDTVNGELPDSTDSCDAYVCTGSRYSVYEDREWISKLKDYVRRLHEARKPFVGICFGHQMLAQALGGEVKPAAQGWGVGIHDMHITQPESWMQPEQRDCKLQYMHADQVQQLPPNSVVLAEAPHCPVAMFRVGEHMLGIEGHPEFPAPYVEALVLNRKERIGEARAQAALESLDQKADDAVVAHWIANFLRSRGGGLPRGESA
jgi:GMP synthase-like glutamine amidotransferase